MQHHKQDPYHVINTQAARKAGPKHCSVTMDTILLEVGTGELLLFQGRVVVNQVGTGTLGVGLGGLLAKERNPLGVVERYLLMDHEVPEGKGEIVCYGVPE